MSREIKFRFWHKRVNKFDNGSHETLGWLHNNKVYDIYNDHGGMFSSGLVKEDVSDRVVVQQYTGLKDKNDVEIYEGDIINNHEEYNNKKVVNYDPYGCYFCLIDIDEYPDILYNGEMFNVAGEGSNFSARLEVIGNIFEGVDK